jgi:RNA polymerase sigma-70 factor (ECF subfamily)
MTETQWLTIYRETLQPLYTYISRRAGGERDLSEDIVQETYLRALNIWLHRQVPEYPIAWLKRVARNLLISYLRKVHWRNVENFDFSAAVEELSLEELDKTQQMFQAMTRLKKNQARILEDFHFDGKTVKEIAQDMKITERAVEGRLRRARQALKSGLFREIKRGGKNDQKP